MDHKENSFNIDELHTGAIEFLTLDEFAQKTGVDKNLLLSMKNNGFLIPSKYIEDVEFYSTELFNSLSQKISNFQKVIPTEHDLTISQLARKSGIDEQTLFLMEKEGFIKGRTFDGVHYYKDNILSTLEENHEAFDSYMNSHYNEDGTAVYDEEDDYFNREERDYIEMDENDEDIENEDDENSFNDDDENYLDEYRKNMTRFHGQNMSHSEMNAQKADTDAKIRYSEEAERAAKRLKEEQERNNRNENYTYINESPNTNNLDYEKNRRITEEENRLRAELDKATEAKRLEEYKKLQSQAKEYEEKTKKLLSEESFGKQGIDFSGHGEHYNSEYETRQREIKKAEELKHSEETAKNYNSSIESEKQRQRDYQEKKDIETNTYTKPFAEYDYENKYKETSEYKPSETFSYDSSINSQDDISHKSTNYEESTKYEYPKQEYKDPEYKEPKYKESEYKEPEYKSSEYKQPEYKSTEYKQSETKYNDTAEYTQKGSSVNESTEYTSKYKESVAETHVDYQRYTDNQPEYKSPKYEEPKYKESDYQTSKYEAPKYETPKYETPKYEPQKYKEPEYQSPKYEVPKYETPQYEESKHQTSEYKSARYEDPTKYSYKEEEYRSYEDKFSDHKQSEYISTPQQEIAHLTSHDNEYSKNTSDFSGNNFKNNEQQNYDFNTRKREEEFKNQEQSKKRVEEELKAQNEKRQRYEDELSEKRKIEESNKEKQRRETNYNTYKESQNKHDNQTPIGNSGIDFSGHGNHANTKSKTEYSSVETKYNEPTEYVPKHKDSVPETSSVSHQSYTDKQPEYKSPKYKQQETKHNESIEYIPRSVSVNEPTEYALKHKDSATETPIGYQSHSDKQPEYKSPEYTQSETKHNDTTEYIPKSVSVNEPTEYVPKHKESVTETPVNYQSHKDKQPEYKSPEYKQHEYKQPETKYNNTTEYIPKGTSVNEQTEYISKHKEPVTETPIGNQSHTDIQPEYKQQKHKSPEDRHFEYKSPEYKQSESKYSESTEYIPRNASINEQTEYVPKHKEPVTETSIDTQNTEYKTPNYTEHKQPEAIPSDSKYRQPNEYIPRGSVINEPTEYTPKHKEVVTESTPVSYQTSNFANNKEPELVIKSTKQDTEVEFTTKDTITNEPIEYVPKHKEPVTETSIDYQKHINKQPEYKSPEYKQPEIKYNDITEYIPRGASVNEPTEYAPKHKEPVTKTPVSTQKYTDKQPEYKSPEYKQPETKHNDTTEYIPRGASINEPTEYVPKYKEPVTETPIGVQKHTNKQPEYKQSETKHNESTEYIPKRASINEPIKYAPKHEDSVIETAPIGSHDHNLEHNKEPKSVIQNTKQDTQVEFTTKGSVTNGPTEYIPEHKEVVTKTTPVGPQNTVEHNTPRHTEHKQSEAVPSDSKHRQPNEYIPRGITINEPTENAFRHKEIVTEATPVGFQNTTEYRTPNHTEHKQPEAIPSDSKPRQPDEYISKGTAINEPTEYASRHKEVVTETTPVGYQARNIEHNKEPEFTTQNPKQDVQVKYSAKSTTINEQKEYVSRHKEFVTEATSVGSQNTTEYRTPNYTEHNQPEAVPSDSKYHQFDEYISKGANINEPAEKTTKYKEYIAEPTPVKPQTTTEHKTTITEKQKQPETILPNSKQRQPDTQIEYSTFGTTANEPKNAAQHKEVAIETTNIGYQTNINHHPNTNTKSEHTQNQTFQKQIDEVTKNIKNLKTQVDIHSTSVKNAQNSLNDLSNRASKLRNEIQSEEAKLSQFAQNNNSSFDRKTSIESNEKLKTSSEKEKIQRSIDSKQTELKAVEASISSTLKYIEKTTEKINDKQQDIKNKTNELNVVMEQYNNSKDFKNISHHPLNQPENSIQSKQEISKTELHSKHSTNENTSSPKPFTPKELKSNDKSKPIDKPKSNQTFNPVAAAAFVANQALNNEKLSSKSVEAKYKLTDKTKIVNGVTLYQIQAIRDFGGIKKGMEGGWVEGEHNLSQEGTCWISNEAIVMGNSRVEHSAIVKDNAVLSGSVKVSNNARIINSVTIHGKVDISDKAFLSGNARISNNEKNHEYIIISGNSRITDKAIISNNAKVSDKAMIGGQTVVSNNANISGNTRLLEHTNVIDNVKISGDVIIQGNVSITGNSTIKGKVTINPQNKNVDILHIENRLINGSFNITNRNELNEHSVNVPKIDNNGDIINEVKNYGIKGTKKIGDASLISTVKTPNNINTFKVNPLKNIPNSTPYNTQLTKTSSNDFSIQSNLSVAERQKLFTDIKNNNDIKLIEQTKLPIKKDTNNLIPKELTLSTSFMSNEINIKNFAQSLGSTIKYDKILIPDKTVLIHRIQINQDIGNYKAGTILTFVNSNHHETLFATMEESIFMDNGEINPDLSVSRNLSDTEIDSVLGNTMHTDKNNTETIKSEKLGSPNGNPLETGQERSHQSAHSFYANEKSPKKAMNKEKFAAFDKKLKQIKKSMHLTGKVSRTIGSYVIRNNGLEETEPMQFVHLASAYTAWITASAAHSGAKELAKIEKEMIEVILLNKGPKVNLVTSAANFKDATKRLSTKGIFNDSLFVNYNSALSLKMYKNYLNDFGKFNGLGELTKLDEKQLLTLLSNKNLTKDQIKAINAAKDLLDVKSLKKNAIANVLNKNNINFGSLNLSLTNINSCRQLLFMIDKHQISMGSSFAFKDYSNKQLEQIIKGKLLHPRGREFTLQEKDLAKVYLHGRKKLSKLQEAKQAKSKKFGSYMRLISSVLRGSDALEGGLMIYRTVTTAIQAIAIAKFFSKLAGKALLRALKYTNKNAYAKITNVMETGKNIKKDIKNTLSTQKETVKQATKDFGKDVSKLAANKIRTSDRFIRLKNSKVYNKFKKPAKFASKMGKSAAKAVQTIAKPFKLLTTGVSKISSFVSKAMTKVILVVGGLLLLILLFIVFMSAAATITSTVTGWFTGENDDSNGDALSSVTFYVMDNFNLHNDSLKEFDQHVARLIHSTTKGTVDLKDYEKYLKEEDLDDYKTYTTSYKDPVTNSTTQLSNIYSTAVYNYYNDTLLNKFTNGSWNRNIIIDGEDKFFEGKHTFDIENTTILNIGTGDMIPMISNNKSILTAGHIFSSADYGDKGSTRRDQFIAYCQNAWNTTHWFDPELSKVFCSNKNCSSQTIKCFDASNSSVRTKFNTIKSRLTQDGKSLTKTTLNACSSFKYHSINHSTGNTTTVYCNGWHRVRIGSSYEYVKCVSYNNYYDGIGHTYKQGNRISSCDKLVTKTANVSALKKPTKSIANTLISEIDTYLYGYEGYFMAEYLYDIWDDSIADTYMNINYENVAYLYHEAGYFGYNISGEELLQKISNGQKYYEYGNDYTTEAYIAFVSKLTNYKHYKINLYGTISSSKFTIPNSTKTVTYQRYECQGYCPGHTVNYCTGHLHVRLNYHVVGIRNIKWNSSKNCFVYTSYDDDRDYYFQFFNEIFNPPTGPTGNSNDFVVDEYIDYEEGTIKEYFEGWNDNGDGYLNNEDSNIDWATSLFDENWFDLYNVSFEEDPNDPFALPYDHKKNGCLYN